MSEFQIHPGDDTLLKEIDGELTPSERSMLDSHLQGCSECRTRSQEFRKSLGQYMFYREARHSSIPQPPEAWPDLMPRLEEAERSLTRTVPIRPPARTTAMRWLAVAACLVIAVALVRRFQSLPSV